MPVHYGTLPFPEQIAYFLAKQLVATKRWDDLRGDAHRAAFTVAGALKADLLADLYAAMEKAHTQRATLAQFRDDFDKIVAKRGWKGWTGEKWENEKNVKNKSGKAWRTRVIYETNLRASYQAGRWEQIQAVKKHRPYLVYKHSHAVLTPRQTHLAWDGLVVPVDSPWVKAHYPIKEYGCQCTMFSASDRDLKRMGKTAPDAPPADDYYLWKDPQTGVVMSIPNGVNPAFHNQVLGVPLSAQVRASIERKLETLPAGIAQQLAAFLQKTPADDLEQAARALGVKTADYAGRDDIAAHVNAALADFAARGLPLPETVRVSESLFVSWATRLDANPEDLTAAFVPHKISGETLLFLNPLYRHWDNPLADAQHQFKVGEWSTAHKNHILHHELGHLAHYKQAKAVYQAALASPFAAADAVIAARVSEYATAGPAEFVAEVFAGLLIGKHFDAEIVALYQKLEGPSL